MGAQLVISAETVRAAVLDLGAVDEREGVHVEAGRCGDRIRRRAGDKRGVRHRIVVARIDRVALEIGEREAERLVEKRFRVVEAAAELMRPVVREPGPGMLQRSISLFAERVSVVLKRRPRCENAFFVTA